MTEKGKAKKIDRKEGERMTGKETENKEKEKAKSIERQKTKRKRKRKA